MQVQKTDLPGVLLIEPRVFGDERGFFFESYNARAFSGLVAKSPMFVQDNHSGSSKGVLRGLHYQVRSPQEKLVRVTRGEIFDVAVDVRRSSPSFGKWVGIVLSAGNRKQMWIPEGFAHGFYVISDRAEVQYKATGYYAPEHERTILWSDPRIAIEWPLAGEPLLSDRDRKGVELDMAEVFD